MSGNAVVPAGANVQALNVKTVSGADDVYAQVNVTGADIWVGFDIKFVADLPPSNTNNTGYILAFADAGGIDGGEVLFVGKNSGLMEWELAYPLDVRFQTIGGPQPGDVVTGHWYHIDFLYSPGSPANEEMWVDGIDQGLVPDSNDTDAVTAVSFGCIFPGGWETAYELYYANMMIGTSKGDDGIWTTSLADLSDFDSTYVGSGGTLTVVTVPGP